MERKRAMITKQQMIDFCEKGKNSLLLSESTQDMFAAMQDVIRENTREDAKWEPYQTFGYTVPVFKCTSCGLLTAFQRHNYCPKCGARMSKI